MPNEILKNLADNPALLEATKQQVLSKFEFAIGNLPVGIKIEELGQLVLARLEGAKLVLEAFKEIERLRSVPEKEKSPNPAR